jgi:hypothetical protein
MFPLARIERNDVPDVDATLNGLRLEVDDARTLNAYEDDVALIPATAPSSRRVEVPSVVDVNQRVAKPSAPPLTPTAVTPRDDVATHLVVVPVVWRIIPIVPDALVESRRNPESERLAV